MQTFKIAATLIVALLLQMLLGGYLTVVRYVDLPLIVTVYFGLQRTPLMGMTVGLIAGLGGDKVFGSVLGVGGFSKTLIGYIVAVISIKFPLESFLARLGVVAVASIINTALFVALYKILEQPLALSDSMPDLGRIAAWKVLADTAAAIVIFWILNKIFPEMTPTGGVPIRRRF